MKLKTIVLGALLAVSISSTAFAEVCNIEEGAAGLIYNGLFCHRGPNAFKPVGDITYINTTNKSIACKVTVNRIDHIFYRGLNLKFGDKSIPQGGSFNFQLGPKQKVEYKPVEWIVPQVTSASSEVSADIRDKMHKIECH